MIFGQTSGKRCNRYLKAIRLIQIYLGPALVAPWVIQQVEELKEGDPSLCKTVTANWTQALNPKTDFSLIKSKRNILAFTTA